MNKQSNKVANFGEKSHKLTKEDRKKGGSTMTAYRLFTIQFKNRKKCSVKCSLFPCLFEPLARGEYNGKCALKQQTPAMRKKFYNILMGKEPEFLKIMSEALIKIADEKDLITYGEKVFKMKFGGKQRIESKGEHTFTIHDLIKAFKRKE